MRTFQEAASAKELRELRALNEALKRSCRESEEAAARRVSESENQRVASDSAARHSAAKVVFFLYAQATNSFQLFYPSKGSKF